MAVTRTTLIVRYPEFENAPAALVTASIVDAELMVDRAVYGTKGDMAVTALAAHYVAINPLGEMARFEAKKGGETLTTYKTLFDQIKRRLGAGFRLI